ncbi:MAG: flavin reductase [Oligoflexus sp.]
MSQAAQSFFSIVDHEVFAITAHTAAARSGMIATWVLPASIQQGYPQCLFLSSPYNFTHELIMESKRFVIHLLSSSQSALLGQLGLGSGRDHDKLKELAYGLSPEGDIILSDTCGYAVCSVKNSFALDERVAIVGEVLQQKVFADKTALTKKAAFANVSPEIRDRLHAKQKEVAARTAAKS